MKWYHVFTVYVEDNLPHQRDSRTDYSSTFRRAPEDPHLFVCLICGKTVRNRWHHIKIHCPQNFVCNVCKQTFGRKDNFKIHVRMKHPEIFSLHPTYYQVYRRKSDSGI